MPADIDWRAVAYLIAREAADYRRALGDANIEIAEVVHEAVRDVDEARAAGAKVARPV